MTQPPMHIEDTGGGDSPVMILHGGFTAGASWASVAATLSRDHRVVVPDLPGYGRSRHLGPRTFDELATELIDIIETRELAPLTVIGFSMGGFVAQRLALAHPEAVGKLILVSTGASVSGAQSSAFRKRARAIRADGLAGERRDHVHLAFSEEYRREHPQEIDRYAEAVVGNDPLAVAATFDAIADHDLVDVLPSLNVPTLVVAGRADQGFGPRAAAELVRLLPDADKEIVASGHTINIEAPDAFVSVVRSFIDAIDRRRSQAYSVTTEQRQLPPNGS